MTEGNDVGGQEEQEPVEIDNNKSNGQSSKKNDPYDFEENRNKPKKGPGAPILQRQNSTTRTSSYIIKDSNNQQTHNKYDP